MGIVEPFSRPLSQRSTCCVTFTDSGKAVSAALEGAKITLAGEEAKTSDLKAGLTCDVVYLGNKDAAQSVTCR